MLLAWHKSHIFSHTPSSLAVLYCSLFYMRTWQVNVIVSLKIRIVIITPTSYVLLSVTCFPIHSVCIDLLIQLVERRVSSVFFKMTISYGQQVATSSGLGVFWKLLFVWKGKNMEIWDLIFHEFTKGSIYKLLWSNIAVYLALYFTLSFTYRFVLDEYGRVRPILKIESINIKHLTGSIWTILLSGWETF